MSNNGQSAKRASFSGKIGYVLAVAGSAVGLGNIWRFPYLAAKYGGGIFLLVYLVLTVSFGYVLIMSETALGRMTRKSPVGAFQTFGKTKSFKIGGWLNAIIPMLIVPYYSSIGGWVIKYLAEYLKGNVQTVAQDGYFTEFISDSFQVEAWFIVFSILVFCVILAGVENGIERVSKIMMPILVILAVIVAIYSVTRPGAIEGVKYFLIPNPKHFSAMTVVAAMGQMFYSMSLAMGIMITYGSYTRDDVSLVKSVNGIEIFDTGIALLAGMMVVPAVYIFSGEAGTSQSGAGLMFMTLPKVFSQMPGGRFIGFMFFALVFLAALTSSVSIMEAITSMLIDRFHISRVLSCAIIIVVAVVLGIPCSLGNGIWSHITIMGMDFLTFFDFISNSLLLPIVAFFTCIMIGWFVGADYIIDEAAKNGEKFGREKIYRVMVKYIAPVLLLIILVFYTLAQFGIIKY